MNTTNKWPIAAACILVAASAGICNYFIFHSSAGDMAATPPAITSRQSTAMPPCAAIAEPVEAAAEVAETASQLADELVPTTFTVTAYCPCVACCGDSADGITATGTIATQGRTVAVDPFVIPLGSVVVIDGHEYIAEDIGGAIDGNHVEIFFDSHEDALIWGKKVMEVEIQCHD